MANAIVQFLQQFENDKIEVKKSDVLIKKSTQY